MEVGFDPELMPLLARDLCVYLLPSRLPFEQPLLYVYRFMGLLLIYFLDAQVTVLLRLAQLRFNEVFEVLKVHVFGAGA